MLDEIGTYLGTDVAALTLGTNLFLGKMQETPAIAVALYEQTSRQPTFSLGGDGTADLENPRLQVHVRNPEYAAGRTMAFDVWESLCKVANQSLTGVLYLRIAASDSPTFLQRDTNDRVIFNFNCDVMKVPSA